ncbi:transcription factor MYB124-like isoform X1 [Asparagus officinalis]|uniref:transcription factor MYB124-like isoform X1 n=1 Tax=Asparagus officinalis TaxID=4686 RepID=UPI00098E3D62|nr:transcription factor MYB124-like isoform X1 [Asparagus officinalis]
MILCEAQKIFGNRWTEIAKVVSGRTDNAVKNRFSTLCKKRAKTDVSAKDYDNSWLNPNDKRVITENESFRAEGAESLAPTKRLRFQILDSRENLNPNKRLAKQPVMEEVQLRSPLSVLHQNINNIGGLPTQHPDNNSKLAIHNASTGTSNETKGSFLKRDDPKLIALLQQAELLSSLAQKVNSENSSQSFENAWKELQDYLIKTGCSGISPTTPDMGFLLEDFDSLIEYLKSESTEEKLSWRSLHREPCFLDSQDSSECSTESVQIFQVPTIDNCQTDDTISKQNANFICTKADELDPKVYNSRVGALAPSEELKEVAGSICNRTDAEFDSPHQTIPSFKSLTEGVPTPEFSASEKRFLLSVLGVSSPAPDPSSAQPPSCKRILLDSL